MKKIFLLAMLLFMAMAYANDPKNEWHSTTLSEETIKKIQESQFQYKKCIANEMQKTDYKELEIHKAAEQVVKQCEQVLADMRTVYLDQKVPEVVADRHLKQMRLKATRSVLNNMMLAEAARKSGQ